MIILNQKKGLGDILGESLAQGFGGGLDYLFEHKYGQLRDKYEQEKQEKQYKKNLSDLISSGYSEPEANKLLTLARIDPRLAASSMKPGVTAINPQQQAQGLSGLGFKPEEAQAISQLDPKLQLEVVKRKLMEPGNQAYASALSSILGGSQAPQNIGALNQQQVTKLAELGLAQQRELARERRHTQQFNIKDLREQQKLALGKEKDVIKNNMPYIKQLNKAAGNAEDIQFIAAEMLELLNTGKVGSGITGAFTPGVLQSSESQRFEQLSNELATKLAGQSGVATNQKIKLAQSIKPNLSVRRDVQQKGLQSILEQTQRVLSERDLANSVIEASKGKQPENLQGVIKKQLKNQEIISKLPNAQEYLDDTIIEIGGKKFIKSNNTWKEIK